MLISMNWIKEFVDLRDYDNEALLSLIHRFSLSAAEVENEIALKGSDVRGVVVAEILSVDAHPNSKKLHLLKVDCGEAAPVDVVCGAPNVRVGMKTAFAKVGARLGEIDIAPRELAGCLSYGMCCSEKELGLSEDHSGIMDLDPVLPNGTDLKSVFAIDDIVFEVDNKSLTNRPDLWGHYGIAREFAALAGRPLLPLPEADLTAYEHLPKVDLDIEDPLCQRYSCLTVEHITRNVSPLNMRIRLFYCGMRAINLLADLTNYLMLEMGQPMHAFDSRRVEKIRIRRFDRPFTFQTLDGVERAIDENTLMICNGDKPVAIAGIMGGLDSEIVEDTTSLTLESATFDAASVRKSTVRLSHRTDSSARYEKSLDPEMTTHAIGRFLYLLQGIDSGVQVTSALTDQYPFHYPQVELTFTKAYVDRYTGIRLTDEDIVRPLKALGFGVQQDGDRFTVQVPSWRATKDVTIKADIIEEITRIYGYDNFAVNTTLSPLYPVRPAPEKTIEDKLKDLLVQRFRLHETHTYIWQYADELKRLGLPVEENVKLQGAVNPGIETLRRSIVQTQLCLLKPNAGYAADFGLFEIGRVVKGLKADGLCDEHKHLAITLMSRTADHRTLYFRLRDLLCALTQDIKHADPEFVPTAPAHAWEHPKNLCAIRLGGVELGTLGLLHPSVLAKVDKKASVVFAELDVPAFADIPASPIDYRVPSKYPGMEQDLTVISDRYAPIAEAVAQVNSPLVTGVQVVSIFNDLSGQSISVRISFAHPDRTLTGEEVQQVMDEIVAVLGEKGIRMKG
ncbi:MAG: phenylalanine--tRNA ligase subunit beta [Clostridia bacterium]|nr:phenylalanine--tRNA ligase subunit beta [Clostridia bacterium]